MAFSLSRRAAVERLFLRPRRGCGGVGVGGVKKQVTLIKLPLHALHLRLVPADPVDALGAQACWKEEKENIVSANFIHLIHDGYTAAAAAAAATQTDSVIHQICKHMKATEETIHHSRARTGLFCWQRQLVAALPAFQPELPLSEAATLR